MIYVKKFNSRIWWRLDLQAATKKAGSPIIRLYLNKGIKGTY